MKDLDVIKQVEKKLNIKLKKLDIPFDFDFNVGYTLNPNGQVNGLMLSGCELKNLNSIIYSTTSIQNKSLNINRSFRWISYQLTKC